MSVPVVAFFNNKGGVGKTSIVYHLAWMFSELNVSTLAVDLDPQSNLTSAFLSEDRLEFVWNEENTAISTIYSAVRPLIDGSGDIADVVVEQVNQNLHLVVGDLRLSTFEDQLSQTWNSCLGGEVRSYRITSAFWRVAQNAARRCGASIILFDLGPNLGAINRASLISSDWVIIPLAPDMYSLQGLRNLGPQLRAWRRDWKERLERKPQIPFELPVGSIAPAGYIVVQHAERLNRPVKAYAKWMRRIPKSYRLNVLDDQLFQGDEVRSDPENLALLKHYRSLMPMAQEAQKPVFQLKPADGAIGAHAKSVAEAYEAFRNLAVTIFQRIGWVAQK